MLMIRSPMLLTFIVLLLLSSGCVSYMMEQLYQPPSNGTVEVKTAPPAVKTDLPSLIEQLKKTVVHINYSGVADDNFWGESEYEIIGSGVIYSMDNDNVYVLTNRHVADYNFPEYWGRVKSEQIAVRTSDDDKFIVSKRFIAADNLDLTILVFDRSSHNFSSATLSNETPVVGEEVLVIGMPELLDWSVSKGIVSGVREFEIEGSLNGENYTAVQTDAAINPGNSGGGMFTMDGTLIGINTWKYIGFEVEGLNFAISSMDFIANNDSFKEKPLLNTWDQTGTGGPSAGIGMADIEYDTEHGTNGTLQLSFTLMDDYGYDAVSDGTLEVNIEDDYYNVLYSGTVDVEEEDFEENEGMPFYGARTYNMDIPYSEVSLSESYYGYAILEFTTNSSMFTKSFDFFLPSALIKEGAYYDEHDYYSDYNYKSIGKAAAADGIEVTLVEGGFYEGDYYSDEYSLFAEFENTGSKKKEVEIKEAVLVLDGKQYDADFLYTEDEDLGEIYPGATVERELLFYVDDSSATKATLYLELRIIEDSLLEDHEVSFQFTP
jgi:S1-C subfamily serine protease